MSTTPTEQQGDRTVTTPFGDATVQDWRDTGDQLVRVIFRHPKVNRVEYVEADAYLNRRPNGMTYWAVPGYSGLTAAARGKLLTWLDDNAEMFAPYRAPLTEKELAAISAKRAASLTRDALRRLTDREDVSDADLADALEASLAAYRERGISFVNQWLNG